MLLIEVTPFQSPRVSQHFGSSPSPSLPSILPTTLIPGLTRTRTTVYACALPWTRLRLPSSSQTSQRGWAPSQGAKEMQMVASVSTTSVATGGRPMSVRQPRLRASLNSTLIQRPPTRRLRRAFDGRRVSRTAMARTQSCCPRLR